MASVARGAVSGPPKILELIKFMQEEIKDPVSHLPLSDPRIIEPCGHRVSASVLSRIGDHKCPVCRGEIAGSMEDRVLNVLSVKLAQLKVALGALGVIPREEAEEIEFPGTPGVFDFTEEPVLFDSKEQGNCCLVMGDISDTSELKEVVFHNMVDCPRISIEFSREGVRMMGPFLEKFGIQLSSLAQSVGFSFSITDKAKIRLFLICFIKSHDLSEACKEELGKIIEFLEKALAGESDPPEALASASSREEPATSEATGGGGGSAGPKKNT